jgi:lipopolysaccharide/colanic/teichoic acid biosynthesis glycosyltransferase
MKVGVGSVLGADGKVLTLRKDARVTIIGRFLRLGFDELPQLLNIVKGDMCLIGPRPDVVGENRRYTERQAIRLCALPGITGLAQVIGGREMNNAQNYELDVRYVEQAGFWTDLLILLVTLPYSFGARKLGSWVFRRYLIGIEQLA